MKAVDDKSLLHVCNFSAWFAKTEGFVDLNTESNSGALSLTFNTYTHHSSYFQLLDLMCHWLAHKINEKKKPRWQFSFPISPISLAFHSIFSHHPNHQPTFLPSPPMSSMLSWDQNAKGRRRKKTKIKRHKRRKWEKYFVMISLNNMRNISCISSGTKKFLGFFFYIEKFFVLLKQKFFIFKLCWFLLFSAH